MKLQCDQAVIQATQFYGSMRQMLADELANLQAAAAQGPQAGFNEAFASQMNELSDMLIYREKGLRNDEQWYCFALDAWLENVNSPSSPTRNHPPFPQIPANLKAYMDSHPDFKLPFEVPANPGAPAPVPVTGQ